MRSSATRSVRKVADQEAGVGSHISGRLRRIAIAAWQHGSALLIVAAKVSCRAAVAAVTPEQPGCFVLSSPGRRSKSGGAAIERCGAEGTTRGAGSGHLPNVAAGMVVAACRTHPLCAEERSAGEAGCGYGGVLAVGCGLLRRTGGLCSALRVEAASQLAGRLAFGMVVLSQVCLAAGRQPWSRRVLLFVARCCSWLRRWRGASSTGTATLGVAALDVHRGDYSAGTAILGGAAYVHITTSVSYFFPEREHEKWSWSLICGHSLHACVPLGDGVGVAGVTDTVVRVTPPDPAA